MGAPWRTPVGKSRNYPSRIQVNGCTERFLPMVFFCRHVKGLRFQNVNLGFGDPDQRPALICEDVEELIIEGFSAEATEKTTSIIRLHNVRTAMLSGLMSSDGNIPFIELTGKNSDDVSLGINNFERGKTSVKIGSEVPKGGFCQWRKECWRDDLKINEY